MKRVLEYATNERNGSALRTAVALSVLVVIPVLLWILGRLEFELEPPPPGNGYVLEDDSRRALAVILFSLAIVWVIAAAYLLRKVLRSARNR